jgi:hypothetical protein
MFPYNQQPTDIPHQPGQQPEILSDEQKALLKESLNLSDDDFARAAMHPEVLADLERQAAARLDTPLPRGWLGEVNKATGEFNQSFVDQATYYEPTAAERASGEHVKVIDALTPRLVISRRSEYVKRLLAGKTKDDFDLTV